ncbi:hypothetical protein [Lewinella sp. W8]|uniref:hypothetical protein n=1 Tax=Lewinella sp. W8 TaxID=2528208 RepID=UPI0010683A04|nr:hypothetical protein [Lewinella sp. W8]MTB50107.1 hypothetical protein [Lewinella sp. W8]
MKYRIIPFAGDRPRVTYRSSLHIGRQYLPKDRLMGFRGSLMTGLFQALFENGDYLIGDWKHEFYLKYDLEILSTEGRSPWEVLKLLQSDIGFELIELGREDTYSIIVRDEVGVLAETFLGGNRSTIFGDFKYYLSDLCDEFGIPTQSPKEEVLVNSSTPSFWSMIDSHNKNFSSGWYPKSATVTLAIIRRRVFRLK